MEEVNGKEAAENLSNTIQENTDSELTLEYSDDNLEIDLNETLVPQRTSTPLLPVNNGNILENIEEEIEKRLNEKAEKTNLTVANVKSIIRQVLINEHVRALLDKDNDNAETDLPIFEPKLTRAKAKELLSSSIIPVPAVNIPWVPQPPPSETQVLIGEDLKEDDSGDEYVPGEEESEDDKEESAASESDINSLPPPTPPSVCMEDHATQTPNYTEDGMFKIPPPKSSEHENLTEDTANIALRTRSRINLSSTPLEVIEKSFVPPDITTDMYEMDCDDDEWKEFLKDFSEPLEQLVKPSEDIDQDPEYNIMADDEINQVDTEEFRVDKAVKITKKEVKELWDELFDYLKGVSEDYEGNNDQENNMAESFDVPPENVLPDDEPLVVINEVPPEETLCSDKNVSETQKILNFSIDYQQLCIIEQQMRQHVQILTQTFLLSYEHPESHSYSSIAAEYLFNLKLLSNGKSLSVFKPVNLLPAINLVNKWMDLFASNADVAKSTKEHVCDQLLKSIQYKAMGNYYYIATFPKLILETISKSEVFLYPTLLPRIPLKSQQFSNRRAFTDAEDRLLVFGLDQFKKFLITENKLKIVTLKDTVYHVKEYMMPHRNMPQILEHIHQCRKPRCASNPIKDYFCYHKVKPLIHYISPLNHIISPSQRLPEDLPEPWKEFIYTKTVPVSQLLNCFGKSAHNVGTEEFKKEHYLDFL